MEAFNLNSIVFRQKGKTYDIVSLEDSFPVSIGKLQRSLILSLQPHVCASN